VVLDKILWPSAQYDVVCVTKHRCQASLWFNIHLA
jgi:hypothetical protein